MFEVARACRGLFLRLICQMLIPKLHCPPVSLTSVLSMCLCKTDTTRHYTTSWRKLSLCQSHQFHSLRFFFFFEKNRPHPFCRRAHRWRSTRILCATSRRAPRRLKSSVMSKSFLQVPNLIGITGRPPRSDKRASSIEHDYWTPGHPKSTHDPRMPIRKSKTIGLSAARDQNRYGPGCLAPPLRAHTTALTNDLCTVLTLAAVRPGAHITTWCKLFPKMKGFFFHKRTSYGCARPACRSAPSCSCGFAQKSDRTLRLPCAWPTSLSPPSRCKTTNSGKDRVAHELRCLCDVLEEAACFDQLNLGALACLEGSPHSESPCTQSMRARDEWESDATRKADTATALTESTTCDDDDETGPRYRQGTRRTRPRLPEGRCPAH